MRISDWSSDVCSSDLAGPDFPAAVRGRRPPAAAGGQPRAAAPDARYLTAAGAHSGATGINRDRRSRPSALLRDCRTDMDMTLRILLATSILVLAIGRASCREKGCDYV